MIDNLATLWLIIGITLLLSEFLIPGFLIFFFGVGALIVSMLVKLTPRFNSYDYIELQIIIFVVISTILLITLRGRFRKTLKGDLFKEKDDYIGDECKVVETVYSDKPGRIKYQGTTWNAFSTDKTIKKNQLATLIGKKKGEPMVFIIEKREIKEK